MRRIVVLFVLLSVGFAPAPLPWRNRETASQKRHRELAKCARRLSDLGVKWSVVTRPEGHMVCFAVELSQPNRSGRMAGEYGVRGDLPRALRWLINQAEVFLNSEGRF
jgi:hypothetical protein